MGGFKGLVNFPKNRAKVMDRKAASQVPISSSFMIFSFIVWNA